jgi:hypothetical protein
MSTSRGVSGMSLPARWAVRVWVSSAAARQEFGEGKGLGQVVVRPALEAGHPVVERLAGGEQQDRHVVAASPHMAQHVHAVAPGQHPVENEQIEGRGLHLGQRAVAGVRRRHLPAFEAQAFGHGIAGLLFVLDQEDMGIGGSGHIISSGGLGYTNGFHFSRCDNAESMRPAN